VSKKNGIDVFNDLMQIASGPSWGWSKEDVEHAWKDLTPKLNKVIKQINEQK